MTTPVLYTQTRCVDSARVRSWLEAHDIAYVERNVSDDPTAMAALAAQRIFATPLLAMGTRWLLGFRPVELAAAFAPHDDGGSEPNGDGHHRSGPLRAVLGERHGVPIR